MTLNPKALLPETHISRVAGLPGAWWALYDLSYYLLKNPPKNRIPILPFFEVFLNT